MIEPDDPARNARVQESASQMYAAFPPHDMRPIEVSAPPARMQPGQTEINALFRRVANALKKRAALT